MNSKVFTLESLRPIRDGYTISRDLKLGFTPVTLFSLGSKTSISSERYDHKTMYIGASGKGDFLIGEDYKRSTLIENQCIVVDDFTLAGMASDEGMVYMEVILNKETTMNKNVKTNEVFALKELIDYETGSITNMDVVSNNTMKYVLMAFDEGTGLTPHRAPGNAIVFALEGKATIGYEGEDYTLEAGQCFKFEKNGIHSVTANGKFKMALLLVLE